MATRLCRECGTYDTGRSIEAIKNMSYGKDRRFIVGPIAQLVRAHA
jgi:hypothetical protein